jgi:serine/threonine-protein kinase
MPEPNPTDDRTRQRTEPPPAAGEPTGTWESPDPTGVQLAPPTRIGRFEVRAVLGTGSYGRVFLAFDPQMQRQVAIKQPFGEGLRPEYREDFLKEARAAAVIDQHANVCPVYHIDTDAGLPYIVMRFVPGGTLKNFLERRTELLPARSALVVARKIAAGLAAAHAKGVIHRDLKPANVLVDEANGEVLITDFGLARVASRTQAAASLQRGAHGTPYYMPPEQWGSTAFGPITPAADLYSLGVILFELLTGEVPFTGAPFELMTKHCAERPRAPSSLRAGLDPRLDAICLKALEKQPSARYRSAREFADAAADYLRGTGSGTGEALPLGEDLTGSGPAPQPPWGQPPPGPAQPQRPGTAPQSATTASQPGSTLDAKEVVRCPKCKARLEISVSRTRPIDCPMCELKFAVDAGRQARARLEGTHAEGDRGGKDPVGTRGDNRGVRAPAAARPLDDGPRSRRGDRDEIPPWRWKPAARGLRLAWLGMLLSALFAFGLCAAAVASLGDGPSPPADSSRRDEFARPRPADSSESLFRAAYALLGVGLAVGIVVTSVGRVLAARVPEGVRGGTAATLGAVAGWGAAACVAVTFVLVSWLADDRDAGRSDQTALVGVTTVLGFAALLLLLCGEFAFNSYLAAVGRRVRRGFPRGLVGAAQVILWALLACAVFGGAAVGAAAALGHEKEKVNTFLMIVTGGAMCIAMLVAPVWAAVTLWLHVHAAVALGRYAHSEG